MLDPDKSVISRRTGLGSDDHLPGGDDLRWHGVPFTKGHVPRFRSETAATALCSMGGWRGRVGRRGTGRGKLGRRFIVCLKMSDVYKMD